MLGGDDADVDADHAVFQGLADTEDASYVSAVEIAGQAKLGVVRRVDGFLVLVEAKDGCKRAEGFFLGAQHVGSRARNHGRFEKLAV